MEVVVPDVVRRHLVVPEQTPGACVQHEQRVGVQHRPGEQPAVRPLRRAAPGARVRVAGVETTLLVDRDGVPRAAAAGLERERPGLLDRHELPPHRARLRVERVDRSFPRRREADGAEEHQVLPHHRRDRDELLARARQVAPPAFLPGLGLESKRIRVGRAVHRVVVDDESVRAVVGGAVALRPARRTGRTVEREDVAAQVLRVDGVGVGHRRRREDPREGLRRREREAPTHLQALDVAGVDRRPGRRPRALEVAVRQLPDRVFAAPAAAAEQARDERRGCRQICDPRRDRSSQKRCYPIGA